MSVYDTVTEQILKELEAGTLPWLQSWQASLPRNIVSKKEYRGTNVLLLWTAAVKKEYRSPYWLTIKQAGDLRIFEGESRKARKLRGLFTLSQTKKDEKGEEFEYRSLKWYFVFNVEQTEGIPHPEQLPVKPIGEVEEFIEAFGANVVQGNRKAYYLPKFDQIHLPDPEDFRTMADYYAVALHEHTRWTGHPSRLNRPLVTTFGTEEYRKRSW